MNSNIRLKVQLPAVAAEFYQKLSQALRIPLEEALEIGLSGYAFEIGRELDRNKEITIHKYVLKKKQAP